MKNDELSVLLRTSDYRGDHAADVTRPLAIDLNTTLAQLADMMKSGFYDPNFRPRHKYEKERPTLMSKNDWLEVRLIQPVKANK